jgi:hypothetical protein
MSMGFMLVYCLNVVSTAPMFLALQYLYLLWVTDGPCTLSRHFKELWMWGGGGGHNWRPNFKACKNITHINSPIKSIYALWMRVG